MTINNSSMCHFCNFCLSVYSLHLSILRLEIRTKSAVSTRTRTVQLMTDLHHYTLFRLVFNVYVNLITSLRFLLCCLIIILESSTCVNIFVWTVSEILNMLVLLMIVFYYLSWFPVADVTIEMLTHQKKNSRIK